MRTKKFDERCKRIFDFFCQLDSENNYSREVPIVNLIFSNDLYRQLGKLVDEQIEEKIIHLLWPATEVAFTIGYVIGQSFDLTYSDAQKDIEAINKVIREKTLLPYLPREKKGGIHG